MNEAFLVRDRVGNSQTMALDKHWGAHFKPHLEAIAVSSTSTNTSEESFHAHTLQFWHFVLQAWMYCQKPAPVLSVAQNWKIPLILWDRSCSINSINWRAHREEAFYHSFLFHVLAAIVFLRGFKLIKWSKVVLDIRVKSGISLCLVRLRCQFN